MNDFSELFVKAKTENLDTVLDFVNGQIAQFPIKLQNHVGIVIDELFANICSYADTDDVVIRVKAGDCITLEFEDGGKPYNPLTAEAPDVTLSAEEREIGGLGVFMVKKLMDSAEYRHENGRNILTLIKQSGG
jgi:anti-sigma regulatory factor (Ser/Thr protein kinase)